MSVDKYGKEARSEAERSQRTNDYFYSGGSGILYSYIKY